jgi:hypothetical protein
MAIKNDTDLAFKLVDTLGLILSITKETYGIIEMANKKNKNFNKDMFTLCTIAVDYGIIDTVSALLAAIMTIKTSKLSLGSDGTVAIEAQTLVQAVSATNKKVATPTLAIQQFTLVTKVLGLVPELSGLARKVANLTMKGISNHEEKLLKREAL